MNTESSRVAYIHHPLTPDRLRRPGVAFRQNAFHAKGDTSRADEDHRGAERPPPSSHIAPRTTLDGIMFRAPTGEFSEPLAAACRGPEAVRNLLKRPRTVGNCPSVDGLAEGPSVFGHGDAGRVLQITDRRVRRELRREPDDAPQACRGRPAPGAPGTVPPPKVPETAGDRLWAPFASDGWIETPCRWNP